MNIYIHIPFCHSKCAYCAFLSHCDITKEDEYIEAVCREIEKRKNDFENPVETIYFGGGTPSIIKTESVAKILRTIAKIVDFDKKIEITLEANPEDITKEKLTAWKAAGVNRLSIGVQSLNDDVRDVIHRRLSSSETLDRVALAQKYFKNIGIDLISGLPGDDAESLIATLKEIIDLVPNHISLYDLETDNDSEIKKNINKFVLPDEDENIKMLLSGWKLLEERGYKQYEISNFAKSKAFCKHNLDFWQGHDYLGFGLGATSKIGRLITTNTCDFAAYLQSTDSMTSESITFQAEANLRLLTAMRLGQSFKEELLAATGSTEVPMDIATNRLIRKDFTLTKKGNLVLDSLYERLLTG